MKFLERYFERLLWVSRLMVLVAVVASLALAVGVFYMTTVDVVHLLSRLVGYADPALSADVRADVRTATVTYVVKAIDGYLIAAILLIFALGLYELFISRINLAEHSETGPRLLRMQGLDDLKDRVAKLVLLVLMIEFFQQALQLKYVGAVDLLSLALSILLIAAAFFLSSHWTLRKDVRHERVSPGLDATEQDKA